MSPAAAGANRRDDSQLLAAINDVKISLTSLNGKVDTLAEKVDNKLEAGEARMTFIERTAKQDSDNALGEARRANTRLDQIEDPKDGFLATVENKIGATRRFVIGMVVIPIVAVVLAGILALAIHLP